MRYDERKCISCDTNCATSKCNGITGYCSECDPGWYPENEESRTCTKCDSNYFMIPTEEPICRHYDTLTHCKPENKTQKGCMLCEDGYRLQLSRCVECGGNCTLCTNDDICLKCEKEYETMTNWLYEESYDTDGLREYKGEGLYYYDDGCDCCWKYWPEEVRKMIAFGAAFGQTI